jgi:hypothetical protein
LPAYPVSINARTECYKRAPTARSVCALCPDPPEPRTGQNHSRRSTIPRMTWRTRRRRQSVFTCPAVLCRRRPYGEGVSRTSRRRILIHLLPKAVTPKADKSRFSGDGSKLPAAQKTHFRAICFAGIANDRSTE